MVKSKRIHNERNLLSFYEDHMDEYDGCMLRRIDGTLCGYEMYLFKNGEVKFIVDTYSLGAAIYMYKVVESWGV